MIYFLYDYVLPSGYCPNALETNHFLLNYMYSQHNTGLEHGQAYSDPGNSTARNEIFRSQLGDWTNSWSVPNLESLSQKTPIQNDSLYEGKKKTDHYFYVIKTSPHIDQFAAHGVMQYPKTNGNYFWKYMSQEALEDVRNKKATILLDYAQENYIEKHEYENLHRALEFSFIPPSQIILVFNTFNGQDLYDKWFKPHERKLQVRNWPFVMWNSSKYYKEKDRWNKELEKTRKRPNHFLFKIKSPRPHRKALLYSLYAENILEFGDWSYLSDDTISDTNLEQIKHKWKLPYDKDISPLRKKFPKQLSNEPTTTIDNVSAWTDQTDEPYRNSYFYICTETYFHGEHKSLTEKVFKPIGNYQPFFFMAFPGALRQLRSLGFKTFFPYIDESYDDEIRPNKRLKMIVKEIKRLCAMSQEEIHNWYWSMEEILEHNRNHLETIHDNEPLTKDFINFLNKRAGNEL